MLAAPSAGGGASGGGRTGGSKYKGTPLPKRSFGQWLRDLGDDGILLVSFMVAVAAGSQAHDARVGAASCHVKCFALYSCTAAPLHLSPMRSRSAEQAVATLTACPLSGCNQYSFVATLSGASQSTYTALYCSCRWSADAVELRLRLVCQLIQQSKEADVSLHARHGTITTFLFFSASEI